MKLLILGFLLTWRFMDIDGRYFLITDDGEVTEIRIEDTEIG